MKKTNKDYIRALKADKEITKNYYQKFLGEKSEQQKFLEKLLSKEKINPKVIADIACGAGTLTHHIGKIYPKAKFILVDLNSEAIKLAKENIKNLDATFLIDTIYNLKIADNSCDLVFCWQTLSWLDNPQKALGELVRICKPRGRIYASSLFNINSDVDIYANVIDHTRESAKKNIAAIYNTYSKFSIDKWLKGKVKNFKILEFIPEIDFRYDGKGMGTKTVDLKGGKKLQISGGLLMNWGVLVIDK